MAVAQVVTRVLVAKVPVARAQGETSTPAGGRDLAVARAQVAAEAQEVRAQEVRVLEETRPQEMAMAPQVAMAQAVARDLEVDMARVVAGDQEMAMAQVVAGIQEGTRVQEVGKALRVMVTMENL